MQTPHARTTAALVMLLCSITLWACPAPAGAEPDTLEGSWAMTVVATSPPGLPTLGSLITFTRGGEAIESRRGYLPFSPFGPILETAGHGVWARMRHGEFAATFTFLVPRSACGSDSTAPEPPSPVTSPARRAMPAATPCSLPRAP